MKYDTREALIKHEKKFCTNSEYGNILSLEKKLHDLGDKNMNDPKLGIKDIRSFLRGDDPTGELNKAALARLSMGEVKDYFDNKNKILDNKNLYDNKKRGIDYKDDIQQLKNKKHLLRLQEENTDGEVIELLKELEKAKEKDLRAQIDKEEIKQALKDMDQTALTHADRQKRNELEKLSSERENLRIREQQMIDDIKAMENSMINKEKKFRQEADEIRKENNDDIFAVNEIKKKELEMAKERGDAVVQLQHKRKQLERERDRIMNNLDNIKDGRNNHRPNSGLSNAGANIMGRSQDFDRADLDPAIKDKIIADQVKINHLREQQQKLKDQKFDMDQIDMLQDEVNHNIRNDYPKSAKSPFKPSAPPSYPFPENMNNGNRTALPPPAVQTENMADDLQGLRQNYVNNGGDDPNFLAKVNDLNDFINHRAPPKVQNKFGVENNETKVADHPMPMAAPPMYGGVPGMMPGMVPPAPYPPYGGVPPPYPPYGMPPDPYAHNPNLSYMDSLVKQTEEENKKLQDQLEKIRNDDQDFGNIAQRAEDDVEVLKRQLLPNGASGEEPFPEDFVFRQNDFRSEDLEVEERALMNVAAQEYDHLRLLSRLPTNSELYRYKMDQYKELSTMRAEIEKVLQEQRLEKIRRDYEKQKYEDERRYNHERWLEEQKREILAAKLRNQAEGKTQQTRGEPNYDNPQFDYPPPETQNFYDNGGQTQPAAPPRPATTQFPPKTAYPNTAQNNNEEKVYDPKVGFLVFFDVVSRLPRQHNGMQIVHGCYNNGRSLTDNRMVTHQDAEQDPEAPNMNRVVYDVGHQVKNVQPHPSTNLIIETQVPDTGIRGGPNKYKSYGWSVVNLFDYTYDFHAGEFMLPLYTGQTKADIDTRDINTLSPLEDTFVCMRVAIPGDTVATSQYLPEKSTSDYRVPSIHRVDYLEQQEPFVENDNFGNPQPQQNGNDIVPYRQPQVNRKAPTEKDPFYRCNGIGVFVHYVKQFPTQSTIKVGATLMEESSVVRIGHDSTECNWISYPIDAGKVLMAKWKNKNQVQPHGAPIIDRTKPEEDQYLVGQKPDAYNPDNEDILVPVNNEVVWEHDFYKLLWDKNLRNELFLIVTLFEASIGLDKRVHPSQNEYVSVAYGAIKLNNPDGTIRYGTFDIPCYNPPVKNRNHDPDKRMKSSIKVTVSQPLPSMPKQMPYQNNPLKPNAPTDIPMIAPPPNRPPEEAPFIPNDKEQYNDEFFKQGEGIDFYVDTGRFFPENCSYSRITIHGVSKSMKQFIDIENTGPDIEDSKARDPFYAYRGEIRKPKMDPTSMLIFTIDSFDLSVGKSCIIGHAVMPLFLDPNTKTPCRDSKLKSFILQDGNYQLPIFHDSPKDLRSFDFYSFQDLDKIPCATLLIRIRKAPTDEKGKPLGFKDINIEKARENGLVETPNNYGEGVYNTTY